LSTTLELLATTSFASPSVEAIAKQAGVGKPTVYRRWPTKAALVADAIARVAPEPHVGACVDLRAELRRSVVGFVCSLLRSGVLHMLYSLVGEGMVDPDLDEKLREVYLLPRRRALDAALRRGIEAGLLRSDLDSAAMLDLLLGPMLHNWLGDKKAVDEKRAGELFDAAWAAIAVADVGG
jgi:AcrR family transcriptional regulator